MNIVEKISILFEHSGKSANSILKELSLSPTALSEWKRGKAKPTVDAIIKVAKYFNISADYLLGTEPTDEDKAQGFTPFNNLTSEQQELLMYFNEIGERLGSEAQKALITYAKFVAEGNK